MIPNRLDPDTFKVLTDIATSAHLLKTHEAVYFIEPAPVLFQPGDGKTTKWGEDFPVRLPPNPRFTL